MTEGKKRGRPSTGKRGTFTFRVTDTLRARLVSEADAAQRPVSEIIEQRLEQSFAEEEFAKRAALNLNISMLARHVARSATFAELISGKSWNEDDFTRDALIAAVIELIKPSSEEDQKRKTLAEALMKTPEQASPSPKTVGRLIAKHASGRMMGGMFGKSEDAK